MEFSKPVTAWFGNGFKGLEDLYRSRLPWRVESEISTMRYIRTMTSLYVPKVIDANSDLNNPTGAPYIVMDQIEGVSLSSLWLRLAPFERTTAVLSMVSAVARLFNLEFDSLGSLIESKNGKIVVGPMLSRSTIGHGEYDIVDQGPWRSSKEYLRALAHRELSWLRSDLGKSIYLRERVRYPLFENPAMSGNSDPMVWYDAFVAIQEYVFQVASQLDEAFPRHASLSRPTLTHPRTDIASMIVSEHDPTTVSGLINWQDSAVVPLWSAFMAPIGIGPRPAEGSMDRALWHRLQVIYKEQLAIACPNLRKLPVQDCQVLASLECLACKRMSISATLEAVQRELRIVQAGVQSQKIKADLSIAIALLDY
ncbi:hypothetical protein SISNIDRAFT_169779 [Sistotremastrum niveocremeum HHB9708]|uniref:Aminoglycoside phosphotransferase domain-containing protein n=1 Tax=Sistotremastrum niveocremeum HHB9708 TaxID=1314777 RepID=A0A164S1W1_9AGAM|nr:hypothetical protein SISNIDRAFT_169779 [Sistotremastrum niveocremeum HHB9708]